MRMESIPNTLEKTPRRILEIGARDNSVIKILKEHSKEIGYSVISDIHEIPLAAEALESPVENVGRVVAAAYQLPFKDASFDDIIAMNFFGNTGMLVGRRGDNPLPSPLHGIDVEESELKLRLLFKELARVLPVGGEVCIIETYTPFIARLLFKEYSKTYEEFFILTEKSSLLTEEEGKFLGKEFGPNIREIYALKKK